MSVNAKKNKCLLNRTNYFNPTTTRVKVRFSSPDTYQSRQIKIEGYETRLYWQFRYCDENDGQTFFYTLTYNDAALPQHYGMNCFDYNDLRDLLTGGFRKQLLRNYGTTFKYFVGAELGDGKGSRGLHNNPHYHILFFLENAHSDRYPYVKISPEDFRHLVRTYWQGFDEDTDGIKDYRDAKYGIAREGENIGLVTDFRACKYVSKYVTKDVKLVQNEKNVRKKAKMAIIRKYKPHKDDYTGVMDYGSSNILAHDFFNDVIKPMYAYYLKDRVTRLGKVRKAKTLGQLIKWIVPDIEFATFGADDFDGIFRWYDAVHSICLKLGMWQDFCDYRRVRIDNEIKEAVNTWRNVYSNKVRISHGVGDYALPMIDDLEPSVQVPDKKGFKNRPLPMYYYRKKYMNVEKDAKGQNIYVLNDIGIQYKLYNLEKRIKKTAAIAESNFNLILHDEALFERIRESDINTTIFWHYPAFFEKANYLLSENNIKQITRKYAEYKLVYEDRFFAFNSNGNDSNGGFPTLDCSMDYCRFLQPSYYSADYDPCAVTAFMESTDEGYLPYTMHPYFLRYISIFGILDMCADYFFVQNDNKAQREAEEIAEVRRYHKREQLKDFYKKYEIKVVDDLPF